MAAMTPYEAASLRVNGQLAKAVDKLADMISKTQDVPYADAVAVETDAATVKAAATTARTFRFHPDTSAALDAIADQRFGGNKTAAISASVRLAAIVYGTPDGLSGTTPAESLRYWAAAQTDLPRALSAGGTR